MLEQSIADLTTVNSWEGAAEVTISLIVSPETGLLHFTQLAEGFHEYAHLLCYALLFFL